MNETDSLVPIDREILPPAPPKSKLELLMIIGELFSVKEKVDELLTFNIDNKGIQLVKNIVDYLPDTFNSISDKVNEILKDGVLNTDDVPVLVNLVKDVANSDIKLLKKILPTVEEVLLFLKTLLEILINKNYIQVENKEKVFELLNISFLLLSTTIDIKDDCITSIKKLFKC